MMAPFPPLVQELQTIPHAPPALMDRLWSEGWRHFGRDFFRYSLSISEAGELQIIQPLRLEVPAFHLSGSQRRVVRRNADAEIRVVAASVDAEREAMFLRHRTRFVSNIPESLRTFMPGTAPDTEPCECVSVEVRVRQQLVAVSYLDVGEFAVSSVYAMFDPDEAWRSLGTLTLLREIEWASAQGMRWLYTGYATVQPSHYDYKKSFRPQTYYDWRGNWLPLSPCSADFPVVSLSLQPRAGAYGTE